MRGGGVEVRNNDNNKKRSELNFFFFYLVNNQAQDLVKNTSLIRIIKPLSLPLPPLHKRGGEWGGFSRRRGGFDFVHDPLLL